MERALFLREYSNRMYGTLPYYLAKNAVELPYQLIMPIFFAVIIYWILGLRNTADCFWIFCTLTSRDYV
ncbi:MAG: ABC transporter permease [Candidatus Pacebacteria bacterium]|nr:ABC transporter permease [Candidatus Paceibacterota bacterium]